MKAKYLKEAAKEYGKSLLNSMKWFIPASAGVIVLGALALEAADEESAPSYEVPVEEPKEEAPIEEHTNEETPVEESEESAFSGSGDENLKNYESSFKEE